MQYHYMSHIRRHALFVLLFAFLPCVGLANMASPWIRGTSSAESYTSQDIDILSEHIFVAIRSLHEATFKISYKIYTDRSSRQIPLIFDTMSENDDFDFRVWVDSTEIPVSSFGTIYGQPTDSVRQELARLNIMFKSDKSVEGCMFFEVDLEEGEHVIYVEYTARPSYYLGGWVAESLFLYNLEPAKHWKSFGWLDLEIAIAQDIKADCRFKPDTHDYSSGQEEIDIATAYKYHYDELTQGFEIKLTPQVEGFAKTAICIAPEGFMLICFCLLAALHIYFTIRYRKKNQKKRFPLHVFLCSLLIPFICFMVFVMAYPFIDCLIGDDASQRQGYVLLVFIFYPFAVLIYWAIMMLVDIVVKKSL